MTLLAAVLSAVMAAIAALHVYWGFGGLWPGRTEAELASMVVGEKDTQRMPPQWLTLAVSAMLVGIAAWPLMLAPVLGRAISPMLVAALTGLLALVFLVRGFGTYLPAVRRRFVEPFATLNDRYFSPLCIALGLGYLALVWFGGLA